MARVNLRGLKWFPVSMVLTVAVGAGWSYCFAISNNQVPVFIPFIRHSAAFLPQSGIFSIFITIGGFLGILTFLLRYIVVKHRAIHSNHSEIPRLNKISLCCGIILIVCFMYTSLNPLGFEVRTKNRWIAEVLIPHHVGVLSACLFFNIYLSIQAYITYKQKAICKRNVFVHALLCTSVIVCSWSAIFPLNASMKDILSSLKENENQLVHFEYKEYSFYSNICALSEWSFTFFSLLFMFSFYKDFEKVNIELQLLPRRVICNGLELQTIRL